MKNKLLITLCILCAILLFAPITAWAMTDTPEEETSSKMEVHKVAVITTKVDEEGNPLSGATLQIIDSEGNIVDEWITDGTEHTSLVPEGDYTLHEAEAPEGYEIAEDQAFTVKVEEIDINAGVDHHKDSEVCQDYGGLPFYYIESEGEKEEAYCINQDWEEPNNTSYDGVVLTEDNIRTFTPDADTEMSDEDLYNKVLDIIYNRSQADNEFSDLNEEEIRFITEYALKTYTSAEVTTKQAMRDENGRLIRDEEGNLVYEDVRFLRQYRYDSEKRQGYVEDRDNGDGIGKLAQHWWSAHKKKIPARYAEFFYYLINNVGTHPIDMHLYIYSTKEATADGEIYQNLLGVRWFNPYDEKYKIELSMINELSPTPSEEPEEPEEEPEEPKEEKPVTEIVPPKTGVSTTNSENEGILFLLSLCMVVVPIKKIKVN